MTDNFNITGSHDPIELAVYDEHDDIVECFDLIEALNFAFGYETNPTLWNAIVAAMGERAAPFTAEEIHMETINKEDARLFNSLYAAFDTQPNSSESEIVAQLVSQFPDEPPAGLEGLVANVSQRWRTAPPNRDFE